VVQTRCRMKKFARVVRLMVSGMNVPQGKGGPGPVGYSFSSSCATFVIEHGRSLCRDLCNVLM